MPANHMSDKELVLRIDTELVTQEYKDSGVRKGIRALQIRKEEIKLVFYTDDAIVYVENTNRETIRINK